MVSLPMQMQPDPDDPELFTPYVDCFLGDRPYRMLLDTGGSQTRLTPDAYTSTLEVVGERQSGGVHGSPVTDQLVMLPKLTVGPIEKTNLVVVRVDDPRRLSLVGMDVLGDLAMYLDFDKAEVSFAPGGSLPADWPLLRSPRGHPCLELQFAGTSGLAVWDTGAAITVVHDGFVAGNPSLFTPAGTAIGTDSVGVSLETPLYMMAAATAGGITIAEHKVAATQLPQSPMPMTIVLGYPAIKQFVWTMDFPENRWSATPSASR